MTIDLAAIRARILARPLELEGVSRLVWGGDDTNSLIFGICKCEDCHNEHATFEMEVGDRAAAWSIRRRVTGTPEQRGVWALNGILAAYDDRRQRDTRPELRSLIDQQYARFH